MRDALEHRLLGELAMPALVTSLVLFISAMGLLSANVSELRRTNERMQQSSTALVQIAMINTDILRVEMIVRGYVLEPDPVFLTWGAEADQTTKQRIAALDGLIAADGAERAELATLKKLVREHSALFARLTARSTTDRAGVIADIVAYGKQWGRGPIERLLKSMHDNQMNKLAEQRRNAESRVLSAYLYAIGIVALALLLGATGFAFVIHRRRVGPYARV